MNITVLFSIICFIVILTLIIIIRAKYSKFEVRPADIVLALVPIIIYLLVSGEIKTLQYGGLKIETAFVKATESAITPQVTPIPITNLPISEIEVRTKGFPLEIPPLIEGKAEGLEFRLGDGRYAGFAISKYLYVLTKYPFFHYMIINFADGTFFGMSNGPALHNLLLSSSSPFNADDVATWLNNSNTKALTRLPGFISAQDALNEKTDKRKALEKMETLNADTLPVINEAHKFVGIVDRSRLTASLLIDVSNRLRSEK